jgi:hypothetical protein
MNRAVEHEQHDYNVNKERGMRIKVLHLVCIKLVERKKR